MMSGTARPTPLRSEAYWFGARDVLAVKPIGFGARDVLAVQAPKVTGVVEI